MLNKLLPKFLQTSNMAANFESFQTKKERLKTITVAIVPPLSQYPCDCNYNFKISQ